MRRGGPRQSLSVMATVAAPGATAMIVDDADRRAERVTIHVYYSPCTIAYRCTILCTDGTFLPIESFRDRLARVPRHLRDDPGTTWFGGGAGPEVHLAARGRSP